MSMLAIIIVLILGIYVGSIFQNTQNQPVQDQNQNTENTNSSDGTATTPGGNNKQNSGSNIPSGKVLDLSNKGLVKVSSDVFSRTDLEELNLSNNKLTGALPGEIRFLQNLKVLNASNNQMTGVPAEIGQLSKLEVLDLSNNELTGLPYELGNLKNLKVLRLSGNNYSRQDLDVVKKGLPASVVIE